MTTASPPTRKPLELLWPRPRFAEQIGERVPRTPSGEFRRVEDSSLPPEGYRLTLLRQGATITASSEAGFFYGQQTLRQWLELHGNAAEVPGLIVKDYPSFRHRAFLLDVSRDKVPTMSALYELVDLLARGKYNQLQLYMEHTFAYEGHEEVWQNASPLTADEIRSLDAYCRERFIQLVPNQNSFGHFHRWLQHDKYRPLAETPEGIVHPFSMEREPFSLCPVDPKVPELLTDLYDQLLPAFSSDQLNVGFDETFELGEGRSAAACAEHGQGRVFLDFLRQVHSLAAERGRRIQVWGDIILNYPELIAELPEDVVVVEWGYEASHPFSEDAARIAAAGREHYVCPGTSSWQSFAGRTTNALSNLASAAFAGQQHGAAGYMVADWGDHGHLQPWVVSLPGLVAGASFAWNAENAERREEMPLAELLDQHIFDDATGLGRAVCELGNTYRQIDPPPFNCSSLFVLTVFALHERERDRDRTAGVSLESLARARDWVEKTMRAAPGKGGTRRRELELAANYLRFACDFGHERWASGDLLSFDKIPTARRHSLADELEGLIAEHRAVSALSYRPGGIDLSCAWLERIVSLL